MKTRRRDALKLLAGVPAAAAFVWTERDVLQAHEQARAAREGAQRTGTPFKPKFFTASEYATVGILVDLIIPRDERSGSATEAGVPEFMDFIMIDMPSRQVPMRGGLAWLDRECERRFDRRFLDCAGQERGAVLDDIAWPQTARPEMAQGAAFFSSFRDLTATGFWTTKAGMQDLQYIGNTYVPEWKGCPGEALKKLGVSYPSA